MSAVYEMAGLRNIFKDDEQVVLLIAGEGQWFPGIICDEREASGGGRPAIDAALAGFAKIDVAFGVGAYALREFEAGGELADGGGCRGERG